MAPTQNNRIAMVYCAGGSRAKRRGEADLSYLDCSMAKQAFADGVLECAQGCLGLGSCVEACRLDAIHIGPLGSAQTDWEKCMGCGLCVKACPQDLIELVEPEYNIYTACANEEPGPQTRKECQAGCIACGICVKNCPVNAVSIENSHAVIDEEKCIACGMCAVKSPAACAR